GKVGAIDIEVTVAGGDQPLLVVREERIAHAHVASLADGVEPAQQGDAVVGGLAAEDGGVTDLPELGDGKLVVDDLGFLYGQDVDRIGCQPAEDMRQADAQGVHIPGGELDRWHGADLDTGN